MTFLQRVIPCDLFVIVLIYRVSLAMKIIVAVKRVIDHETVIRINSQSTAVETANVKMSMNPFDAIAMEEAIRLKENKVATEIIAVSIGTEVCQETLRTALAMGADRAILIKTETDIQPLAAATLLKHIVEEEKPQLVLLGKQAIDTDNNQTGQMLAGLLNWAQGTFVSKLTIENDQVRVVREIDGGLETLLLTLPAVVTTDLRLNEPRYLSLPNIVKAKTKPLKIMPVTDLSIDITSRILTLKISPPAKRGAGVAVENVTDLVNRLKNEAHVL